MATVKYNYTEKKDFFERAAWGDNRVIFGIDEVGRGCLAGPVVTAAVMLFTHAKHDLLVDSKKLSKKQLQIAYGWICQNAVIACGSLNNRAIDEHNIYQATLRSMRRTLLQLLAQMPIAPAKILVDAMPVSLQNTAHEQLDILYFPFGESRSSSIAAASIVAKVTRDNLMAQFDSLFPTYQLARHKGYGTKIHQAALQNGPSLIHRMTFLKNATWSVSAPSNGIINSQMSLLFDQQKELQEDIC